MRKPLSVGGDWDFELIKEYEKVIAEIAQSYGLDTYPNQIEIISSEQMIDAYSSIGMPVGYHHWSFGKQHVFTEKNYKQGMSALAYEIVINSNPCIAYLMEENTMPMQALVIAHACYGHNSFFKNNYLFKIWTSADSIIDYLVFARHYISECEEKYGINEVESILDACHALMNYGVDRYRHPAKLSLQEEQIRQRNREVYLESQVNELWRTIPQKNKTQEFEKALKFPKDPQENLLYFIEKNAPLLKPWQREIVRIVRKIAQYFYPQRQTKVMNEGWATFWHYTILNTLYDEGYVTDEFMLEVLQNHTNVIAQAPFDSPYFNGINPYALGFGIFSDLRRISESPTEEDKLWFPDMAGKAWIKNLDFAMRHFKDESFISQFLSPKLIRDLKFFSIKDDTGENFLEVTAIHNEQGYQQIKEILSRQYNLSFTEPDIQIVSAEVTGDRSLLLHHRQYNAQPLHQNTLRVLNYLYELWGFPVKLHSIHADTGEVMAAYELPLIHS